MAYIEDDRSQGESVGVAKIHSSVNGVAFAELVTGDMVMIDIATNEVVSHKYEFYIYISDEET